MSEPLDEDVAALLYVLGMEKYSEVFAENELTMATLVDITEHDLSRMGIMKESFDFRRIMAGIKAVQSGWTPDVERDSTGPRPDWKLVLRDVQEEKLLGRGGFGCVYAGHYKGDGVAVKDLTVSDLNPTALLGFSREVEIMSSLRHPNIVRFLGAAIEPPQLCYVMENCARGSLRHASETQALPKEQRLPVLMGVARGLDFLHSQNIIHRDLNAMNILLDEDWTAKVCDFGLARVAKEASMTKKPGTMKWMAPELTQGSKHYDKTVDVFPFALIIFDVYHGKEPFHELPPMPASFQVARGKRPEVKAEMPADLRTLMEDCWKQTPAERPLFPEIIKRLEDICVAEGVTLSKLVL